MDAAAVSTNRSDWRGPVVAAFLLLAAAGCDSDIETSYGQRSGPYRKSVNGTAALAHLFEEADQRVSSWRWLSPRLHEEADVIVWFPDDFEPPSTKVCDWFNDWLEEKPDRTLIYVGRDHDATPSYWEKIRPGTSQEISDEIGRRLADARNSFRAARQLTPTPQECDWFAIEEQLKWRRVDSLSGAEDWLTGIDPAKVEIELHGRLIPPDDAEVLLDSEGDVLVSRQWRGSSQLIVVANGSFLLNLPLVNHEHRKLAAHLVAEVGPAPQDVFFLESGYGGPTILDRDPQLVPPTGLDFYGTPPLDRIFIHLAVLGIIFGFSRLPIFGLPRDAAASHHADFGEHVAALGELLQWSGDGAYAVLQIENYRATTRSERSTLAAGRRPARAARRPVSRSGQATKAGP